MPLDDLQNGRYHHVRLLGSGGMGEVYLMQDARVSRQVAIKVIRSEGEAYPDSDKATDPTRLFEREARAIAALDHANILPLYDFGEENREGATITYMVMPYCADGSLEGWLRLRSQRSLAPQEIAYLIEQAAEALQYAHDHAVMHLDVKPSNYLIRNNKKNPDHPTLLLADFGIARNFTTVASASHTIRGTPTSMAPEQWSSSPTFASDQYALAVMAYELLAGRPPFVGRMEQLMYQHLTAQPLPPSTYNPRLSVAIDAVLLRALAKKPEERFPTVSDFASALTQAAQAMPDAPVLSSPLSTSENIAFNATLSISQVDAQAGLSRLITLPGGRQMLVPIPAGVEDGQIIRLANPSSQGEEVVLTIAIDQAKKPLPAIDTIRAGSAQDTPRSGVVVSPVAGFGHDLPTVSVSNPNAQPTEQQPSTSKRSSKPRVGRVAIISITVVILLLAGTIFAYTFHQLGSGNHLTNAINNSAQTPSVTVKLTPSATATKAQNGLYIAGTYNGSMHNSTNGQTSSISVLLVQTQGNAALSGSFTFRSAAQGTYMLSGTVDTQGNFSFTVQQATGQTPLYFHGTVQQGVYLHGNFCSSSTGSCSSDDGYFTVGPKF